MNDIVPTRILANVRGGFDVQLSDQERDLLTILPERMLASLEELAHPQSVVPEALRRLFPPAYPTDASAENAYVRLVREDLLDHHRDALTMLRDSAHVTHLDEHGAESWLTSLTDLRLMLGTQLGISEDDLIIDASDPDYYDWVCYHYLSQLQHEIVVALGTRLQWSVEDASAELPEDPWGEPPGGLRWDGTPTPESP